MGNTTIHFAFYTLILIFVTIPNCEHARAPRTGLQNWLFSTDPDDIRFFLFPNPEDEDYAEEIFLADEASLKGSQFDPGKPVIFLIHGLLGNSYILTDVQLLKNAYLAVRYPANIIIVDYAALAGFRLPSTYLNAVFSLAALYNIESVSERIAAFVFFLKNTGAIGGPRNVHFIGHAFGCNVAGRAGTIIGKGERSKVKRITGLDCPFGGQRIPGALSKENAFFVDVTHTSIGPGRLRGFLDRMGHVDFFVNGAGFAQPNCPNITPFTDPYCRQVSSVFYFAKSIRNKNIFGCYCELCIAKPEECAEKSRYGQYVSKKTRGSFYVDIPQSRNP